MAKEFVIKHGLIVHGEITGSDIRIDDWNSVSASLSELSSNVGETVTTASISGNVITFTKSDGTTFETVVQEDTGSFFTSASVDYNRVTFTQGDGTTSTITIDTGSFEPDRQVTGSFYVSSSVDLNTITFTQGDGTTESVTVETGTTQIRVKNTSGSPITKGTPVYITGNVGATDMLEIAPADASDLAKMPAVGLLLSDLSNNGEGFVVQGGYLRGLVTDTIDGTSTTSNDTIYVKAGGGLTMTKPTGATNYIQNIAKVARVHASAGSLVVSSILRTNDVPNLPTGKIWVGNGTTVTSSFVHLDETNQRFGIGTDTPLKPLHIDNDSVPIRLESNTHNAVVVNYRTDEVGTGNGIQIGAKGQSDFFVQQDVTTGGASQWNVNVYVSQSGKVYLPNLDGGLQDQILYYNNSTGELTTGAQPGTGSFFTSASVDYNRVTFTSGDGTTATITIDTGSFEPDRQDTGSFFTSASVNLNTITFTQGDGTTEVITVNTGSAVTTDISALNTFTGSIQTEVDDLKAATGSYYLSSSNSQATLRLFQADGTSVTHDLFNPNTYVSSSVDSNRITFEQQDGSTEVVTVDTGSKATPAGSTTELQFNDNGAFGATTGITYSSSPQMLALDTTSILIEGKSVPIQLTEGSSASKQTVISYAQSTTSNVGFRVGNNDLGNTGRDIFVIAHGTTNFAASNTTNIFELDQAGSLIMSAYGSGTNTGNPGYYLAVDSTGRIVEELITTGSGGGGTIDTGSFYVGSSVNLNTITFTQGDGTTEVITVDTGSGLTGNGSAGQIALWDASKRLNGDSHFVWNPLNNRMGINIASPESQIHIDGYGQPIRLTSTSNTQMYIRYQNQNSTSEGMRVGNDSTSPYGGDNFVVQWDSGNPSANSWEEIFRVSGSGETFMVGLDNATTSNTLYYNSSTGEVSYGAAPSGGGGGTVDTGSFYVGSSVNLNTITFTQGDGTTESVTIDTGSASGGGGSGTVNTGVAGYLAYYPSNGTTVDDQTGLFWDESSGELGIGTANPARPLHIDSSNAVPIRLSSTDENRQVVQYFGENSNGAGVLVGTEGENDFVVLQSDYSTNTVNANLYVSESGETYLPRLAADAAPSDIIYYDSSTGELSYGSAPSGGGTDTTIYSTNGTLSGNRTLTGNGNSLALSGITTLNLDGDLTQIRGQIYIAESTNSQVSITNATKSDILYFDSTTGEVTYGSAPSGGGGGSIDGTGVANKLAIWSDADTLTNDTNLHWDSSLDRLGIGVAAPSSTVHVGSTSVVPVWLDGLDNSQTSQFIRMSVTGGSNNGLRIGNDGADSFKVQKHNGSSWDTHLEVQDGGEVFAESLGTATSANTLYYNTTTGEITYGAAPSGGGSTSPGGSTTQVQFNNAGSFGGDAGLVYDSANDRLGIGGTGTPTTTLHLAKGSVPLYLDGTTATEATQYIRIEPNGSPGNGVRLGAGYSSPNTDFEIDYHDGSSWDTNFRLAHNGALELPNLGADAGSTTSILYYNTSDGRVTYGSVPSGGGSGTPGGSTTQVQFNDGGSFGGDAGFVYDSTNDRLGIGGTGTPTSTLHLAKGDTPLFLDGTTATEATQYIRVKPNGETNSGIRFGAGYASTTQTSFHISHHNSTWTDIFTLRGSNGALTLSGYSGTNLPSSANDYVLAANGSGNIVKMPFTYSGGRYGIGTTSPTSGKLQVQGNASGVSIYASHDIVAYSDARSKVNIETIPDALEKVNAVRGVTYNKVDDPEGMRYMGVIAQELLEHLPEVVHQGEEGNYSVAYGNVVGVLIEAVKELTAKVEDLESRLGK